VKTDVVLRDYDGSRTIFSTDLPLKDLLFNTETDLGAAAPKAYAKTEEKDDHGRVVYSERN